MSGFSCLTLWGHFRMSPNTLTITWYLPGFSCGTLWVHMCMSAYYLLIHSANFTILTCCCRLQASDIQEHTKHTTKYLCCIFLLLLQHKFESILARYSGLFPIMVMSLYKILAKIDCYRSRGTMIQSTQTDRHTYRHLMK